MKKCMFMRNIFILIFFSTLLVSCADKSKKQVDSRTVFRYNEPGGITSLDPAFARLAENTWATNQLFNGLVQMDEKLNVKPCIARRWEISEDGLVYTFYL